MRIYIGKVFADLILPPRDSLMIFEDFFKDKTAAEYPECWDLVLDEEVVCKTYDAVRSAPVDSVVIRIGRSVRKSDFDQIIETEMTIPEFLFLDPTVIIDRRQPTEE